MLFELCRHVRLISAEPESVLIQQGYGRWGRALFACYSTTQALTGRRLGTVGDKFYVMFLGTADIYFKGEGKGVSALQATQSTHSMGSGYARLSANRRRAELGRYVKTMHPGDSFGEVALRQQDALRTASVVVNGYVSEEDMKQNPNTPPHSAELLVITRAVYERCVLANHESGNVLERKIRHLRSMFLFREWTTSDITFFAYSLQQKKLKDVRVVPVCAYLTTLLANCAHGSCWSAE